MFWHFSYFLCPSGCECHVITHFPCSDFFCILQDVSDSSWSFIACSDIGFTFCSSGCECFYLIIHISCSDIFLCHSVGGCYQLITYVSCFYNLFCFLYTFQDVSVESWLLMFQVLNFVLHFVLFRKWMLQVNHLSSMFWHLFFFFILQDVSTFNKLLMFCVLTFLCLFS